MTEWQPMINTTLNAILKHKPDKDLWEKLLKHLDKTEADNEPLPLIKILESNGLTDALWCLRALGEEHVKNVRLFACDIAEHVLHFFEDKFPDDKSPRRAINMARLYAEGGCTGEELNAAWRAATIAADAAWDAAYAAAARCAARCAATIAADAARCADADAAWDAAGYAAAAANLAARWVAWAAADTAGETILEAERRWQKELFIKYFG